MKENVVLSCPFFHMKIPTEPFSCPWNPEMSPSAGDKNTGEQLHITWRDGQGTLRVVCSFWNMGIHADGSHTIPVHCYWCHWEFCSVLEDSVMFL